MKAWKNQTGGMERDVSSTKTTMQHVTFHIGWAEFSNEDMPDDDGTTPPPDSGWYVDVEVPGGHEYSIGPDHFGDGFATVEEALALCEKWATDRGFTYSPPLITLTVGKEVDA